MSTPNDTPEQNAPANDPKPVVRASQLPDDALQLSEVAKKAAKAWTSSELPALLWLSKSQLTTLAAAFATNAAAAEAAGDQRSPQAARLRAFDKQFNAAIGFVKGYLHEEYEDDESYYPEFGIVKVGKNYQLPNDRDERVKSLAKLLLALVAHGFGEKKYGTAFWQQPVADYTKLVTDSTDTAGDRSEKVDLKVEGQAKIEKALRALIHHIKANYPDSFEAKLRAFGFQKERY